MPLNITGARTLLLLVVAGAGGCIATSDWAAAIVADTRARSYPELEGTALVVGGETEPLVGGRALFAPGAVLGLAGRDYQVRLSADLLTEDAGDLAVRYVAAHELAHILDYQRHPGAAGLQALVHEALVRPWRLERRAELIAVERGYGEGLVAYRRWQRARLAGMPELLAEKRRNYFSPNEARAADEVRRRCPTVFQAFLAEPPRDLREILKRCP